MNSAELFCPNVACPARGTVGKGNIGVHSQQKKRYICHVCQQTFSARKGTLFYRLRTDPKTVLLVIALLVYGCPLQAIVQAFGLLRIPNRLMACAAKIGCFCTLAKVYAIN